jgi:prevent-host-death family protein
MQTIQASEAKAKFLSILDEVERGGSVIVTRHGKPVARIVPEPEVNQKQIDDALANLRAIRKHIKSSSIEEILAMRDEGRR